MKMSGLEVVGLAFAVMPLMTDIMGTVKVAISMAHSLQNERELFDISQTR